MKTTRRTFLGSVGAAAAVGVTDGVKIPEVSAALPAAADTPAPSTEKVLFWVAASTPCDKNLKFDEELYKDVLAYLKSNGADGVVVLGTTGEFPSFSVAERKKVAEVAFKHRNGLNIIVSPVRRIILRRSNFVSTRRPTALTACSSCRRFITSIRGSMDSSDIFRCCSRM